MSQNQPQSKPVVVKRTLDRILLGLLGRQELVDQWWVGANKAFDNKTPLEVYQSTEENRQKVIDYITFFAVR